MPAPVRILHLHSSFSLGGKEARAVRLMNVWGGRARHVIVSGVPDQLDARDLIDPGVSHEVAQDPPPLTGRPSLGRYEAIARFMRGFDLVLTYNWGAIDGVMARRAFGKGAPPLIHHEDGFGADEAGGLKRERNIYRRLALPAAHALVVPSEVLGRIALEVWKQPRDRVQWIPNGIQTRAYDRAPDLSLLPGLKPKPGEVVIGAVAGLREVKDLPALVRAVGGVSGKVRLVIVGEGPERAAIEQAGLMMGLGDRLVMAGFVERPWRFMRAFDIAALSSKSEQFPISVLEAMAAGLPVVAPDIGDIRTMVSPENAPFIAPRGSEVRLRDALQPLVADAALRRAVGAANTAKARADYDEALMIGRYAQLYEQAMGKPGALS
jgi:L-malate glycosyltransferase